MNPRTLAFAVCCVAAAGLVGCSSSQNAPPPPAMPAHLTPAQQRVAKVQMALNANGAQLDVDGRMGPKTVAALKAFQQQHNLKATGRVDAATMKALGG